jgi:hypothetical protein
MIQCRITILLALLLSDEKFLYSIIHPKKTKGLLIYAMVWYSKILLTVDDVLSAVSFPAL